MLSCLLQSMMIGVAPMLLLTLNASGQAGKTSGQERRPVLSCLLFQEVKKEVVFTALAFSTWKPKRGEPSSSRFIRLGCPSQMKLSTSHFQNGSENRSRIKGLSPAISDGLKLCT